MKPSTQDEDSTTILAARSLRGVKCWRRVRQSLILCIALLALLLALGLGLGIGLGLRRQSQSSDGTTEAGPQPSETQIRPSGHHPDWSPQVGATWQIVLISPLELKDKKSLTPDVDVYDVDLYDNSNETFALLKDLGKLVICYFSAGSYENGRPDSDQFYEADMGNVLDGWPDEKWLNVSSRGVRDIMAKRIKLASQMGCDGIDPDNVDGFQNENGLGLTKQDAVDFVQFLSVEADKYGMATGLKNAGDIIADVLAFVDFSVNEACATFDECEVFSTFIKAGKPVFHIEYPGRGWQGTVSDTARAKACSSPGSDKFSTVIKDVKLDGWVEYCDGSVYEMSIVVS